MVRYHKNMLFFRGFLEGGGWGEDKQFFPVVILVLSSFPEYRVAKNGILNQSVH